jgi:peroxiredoxin Q/BCP
MTLEIGDAAPDFDLDTDKGVRFRLSAQRGSPVVLFFYPEDETDGCTIENIEFTEEMPDFEKLGVRVIGISPDSVEKHCRFRDKHALQVTLASDPEHEAIKAYDVWGPKTLFGHHYDGLIRTTFLVGADGKIAGTWLVTRVKGHAAEVLEATRSLVAA